MHLSLDLSASGIHIILLFASVASYNQPIPRERALVILLPHATPCYFDPRHALSLDGSLVQCRCC